MTGTQATVAKALRAVLLMIGMGLVGYLVLLALFIYAQREPDPFLHVDNVSGRPLLLDRDAPLAPGTTGQATLVLGHEGLWVTRGYDCEQDRLVARDVQGTVIARHTGACGSDTWTITGEGLPAAPQHRRGQVPSADVEIRLVLDSYNPGIPVLAWWQALPKTLKRAAAAGQRAGVSVDGPFLEGQGLTLYVLGPDPDTALEFARTQVLRPPPGPMYAYVGAPGAPAPPTGRPVTLDAAAGPIRSAH